MNRQASIKLTINIVLSLALLLSAPSVIAEQENLDFFAQQKLTSHLITSMILEKVDEGGLSIYEQEITRDHLQPNQVAYIHNLEDDSLEICVHFQLIEDIVVPNFEEYLVDRISIVVDKDGDIKEVKAHIIRQ
jgi:hypothetical protein